jgi:hypothetical protein
MASAVGNYSLYVRQRTVRLGRKGYKCGVDGWPRGRLTQLWVGAYLHETSLSSSRKNPNGGIPVQRIRTRARRGLRLVPRKNYERKRTMNNLQKSLSTCLLATVALAGGISPAWAQVTLGAASGFAVLGGTAVTCTNSIVTGDVGSGGAFTNTSCTILGGMPPATNGAAVGARTAFLSAYTALQSAHCTGTLLSTIPVSVTLAPGVYCTGAALTATGTAATPVVLTLDAHGDANAVWIFKIGAALTGTNFSVVMAGGGQPCNVFWAPSAGVTMTTSAFKGNILAGGATGSITLTGGTLAGRALANVAVTMTDASVIDCDMLSGSPSCEDKKHHRHDKDKDHGDDDDKGHGSDHHHPFGSNDDHDGKSGDKDGDKK